MNIKKNRLAPVILAISLVLGGGSALAAGVESTTLADKSEFQYKDNQLKELLEYLNGIRVAMGLKKVTINPYLTKAAENHAAYVAKNEDKNSYTENKGKVGFTGENVVDRILAVGGTNQKVDEVIYSAGDLIYEIMRTGIDRQILLGVNVSEIGIGRFRGATDLLVATNEEKGISVYPYEGQENVWFDYQIGLSFNNPIQELFNKGRFGTPISFMSTFPVEKVDMAMTNSRGEKIPFFQTGTSFYPVYPLSFDEQYTISVNYLENGEKRNKTWSFRSMKLTEQEISSELIKIKLNGKFIDTFKGRPQEKILMLKDGRLFVGARDIFEQLNATVSWDSDAQTITVKKQQTTVRLKIGSYTASVNGKEIALDQVPFIDGGYTFVPLRFISESVNAKVSWDDKRRIASIDVERGEPEDPMAEAKAVVKAKAEEAQTNAAMREAEEKKYQLSKVEQFKAIVANYGYAMETRKDRESDSWNTYYDIKDRNGVTFMAYDEARYIGDSSLEFNGITVPDLDESKLLFMQEAAELLLDAKSPGTRVPDFAKTLLSYIQKNYSNMNEVAAKEVEVGTSLEGTPLKVHVVFWSKSSSGYSKANILFYSNYTGMSGQVRRK
jgi:hypothetical protein